MKANKTTRGQEILNHRKEKTSDQRVALMVAHNQILKQLNGKITTYLLITLNVNGLNSPIKRHYLANWIKKEDRTICCLQEAHLIDRNKCWLRMKD
jgi:hypothetical protein